MVSYKEVFSDKMFDGLHPFAWRNVKLIQPREKNSGLETKALHLEVINPLKSSFKWDEK